MFGERAGGVILHDVMPVVFEDLNARGFRLNAAEARRGGELVFSAVSAGQGPPFEVLS